MSLPFWQNKIDQNLKPNFWLFDDCSNVLCRHALPYNSLCHKESFSIVLMLSTWRFRSSVQFLWPVCFFMGASGWLSTFSRTASRVLGLYRTTFQHSISWSKREPNSCASLQTAMNFWSIFIATQRLLWTALTFSPKERQESTNKMQASQSDRLQTINTY